MPDCLSGRKGLCMLCSHVPETYRPTGTLACLPLRLAAFLPFRTFGWFHRTGGRPPRQAWLCCQVTSFWEVPLLYIFKENPSWLGAGGGVCEGGGQAGVPAGVPAEDAAPCPHLCGWVGGCGPACLADAPMLAAAAAAATVPAWLCHSLLLLLDGPGMAWSFSVLLLLLLRPFIECGGHLSTG